MAPRPHFRAAQIVADVKQLERKLGKKGMLPIVHPTTGATLYTKKNLASLVARREKAESLVGAKQGYKMVKETVDTTQGEPVIRAERVWRALQTKKR